MTDDHSFVPSNQLPKVGPLPAANPNSPAAKPWEKGNDALDSMLQAVGGHALNDSPQNIDRAADEYQRRQRGNFNPHVQIDTSTTTISGVPDHYAQGHAMGAAMAQTINQQVANHINNMQAQMLEQLHQLLFGE